MWIIRIKSKDCSLNLYSNTLFIPDWQTYINNNNLILRLYPPPQSVYVQGLYGIRRASVLIGSRDPQTRPSIDGHGNLAPLKLPFPFPPNFSIRGGAPKAKLKSLGVVMQISSASLPSSLILLFF